MHRLLLDIWENSIEIAAAQLRAPQRKMADEIIFPIWSNAMGEIYFIVVGEHYWKNACDEQKKQAFQDRAFNFENFKNIVFDSWILNAPFHGTS